MAGALQPDANSNGAYTVHNLYLDDMYDSFYHAKHLCQMVRNKYRVRFYNNDLSFIRMERKHKNGLMSYKDTMPITAQQYEKLRMGDFSFMEAEADPMWKELAAIHSTRRLRPAAEYVYRREAFVLPAGGVRVTFDSGDFFPGMVELKYTHFLPTLVRQLLSGITMQHMGISKYSMARERKGQNI
jgi:SPX domain protein involved in polyphosphate accumulation